MTTLTLDKDLARRLVRAGRRVERATRERDDLIVEASHAGASLREIGAAVGLSHGGVARILERAG